MAGGLLLNREGVLYTTLGKSDREMAALLGMGMTLGRGDHDPHS